MKSMSYKQLEEKYLALMSPGRLFHTREDVEDFLKDATTEDFTAFIATCVNEESYRLAFYAKCLMDKQIKTDFFGYLSEGVIHIEPYTSHKSMHDVLKREKTVAVVGPIAAETIEEATNIIEPKLINHKKRW